MMPKGQVKLFVGSCIFMLIFTQRMQHSHRYQAFLKPLAALFGSALPISIQPLKSITDGPWAGITQSKETKALSPLGFLWQSALPLVRT
jgi:hypothetical protein